MSNFVSYLANADVALSVSCTLASTVIGIVATPLLVWLLVGQAVPIAVGGLAITVLKVVIMPISGGMLINTLWHRPLQR